ncbi:polysaccharide biosynthesis C-terminal domain-containing protein [Halobium salinum]|uniref:Polysaccharide biosynthesis C-terminal domain-containing protein n=1 Tax=Halobium salinum TaxID=1364940 RepID=A0ABD5P9V9_9EURY|nr:polysaccharide biosynthesis C-terminal domain-containing protein [Halobium salinum]
MGFSVKRGIASVLGTSVLQLLIGLILGPLLVRFLGAERFGDYVFVMSLCGILMVFVNAGIFDSVRKFLAEDRAEPGWEDWVFAFHVRLSVLLLLIVLLPLLLSMHFGLVSALVGGKNTRYLYLVPLYLIAEQFFLLNRGTLLGLGMDVWSEPLLVLRKICMGAVALSLIWSGFGAVGAIVGEIVAATIGFVIGGVLVSRRLRTRTVLRQSPSWFPASSVHTYNNLSTVTGFMVVLLYEADVILVQTFLGSEQTGYYKAALLVAEFLWFVPKAVEIVFLQSTSEMWSQGRHEEISELISSTTRYTILFTGLVGIGLVALADPFLGWYFGPEFVAAVPALVVLVPGALGFAVARPIMAVGQASGELRPIMYATGAAAALNLVLDALLIPRLGIGGAAIGTTVGYGSMLLFNGVAARSIGFDPLTNLRITRIGVTFAVSAMVILPLEAIIASDSLSLVVVPPVGAVVFSIAAVSTRAVDPTEARSGLKSFIPS